MKAPKVNNNTANYTPNIDIKIIGAFSLLDKRKQH